MRSVEPQPEACGAANVTAMSQHGSLARVGDALEGAFRWSRKPSTTRRNGARRALQPRPRRQRPNAAPKKAKGYEGEICGECGHFWLVRNGKCRHVFSGAFPRLARR
jgi:ribonucleoside-diphosphate reductase alpha chain